jgi:hypothetical protein
MSYMSHGSNTKCSTCALYYAVKDNMCSGCYQKVELPKIANASFSTQTYDSIYSTDTRKKYFDKYHAYFWKQFCSVVQYKHTIISEHDLKFMLIGLYKEGNTGKSFLMANGYTGNGIMATNEVMTRAITSSGVNITSNIHVIGSMLLDPWNSKNENILKTYGNKGIIPQNFSNLMKLWNSNKQLAQQYVEKFLVGACKCGQQIYVSDVDISKAPEIIAKNHKACSNTIQQSTPFTFGQSSVPSSAPFTFGQSSVPNLPSSVPFMFNTNNPARNYVFNPYADDPMDTSD